MGFGQHLYYGHGKLLLTGEYLVLEGAKAIALPTNFGQTMSVSYRRSSTPKLIWKSYTKDQKVWFEAEFELWHFNLLTESDDKAIFLQQILRQARAQNVHFLRDDVDIVVNCHLEFDLDWGLGSSSSIIYNIAQWAYISAFELNRSVTKGSGYDVACAQAVGPIYYQVRSSGPSWGTIDFNPHYKENLFFVHLGKKQNTAQEIVDFKDLVAQNRIEDSLITRISEISDKVVSAVDLREFEELILEHESIIGSCLGRPTIGSELFADYDGVVKSLGAWGGDFILAASHGGATETREYFSKRGLTNVLTYDEMICQKELGAFENMTRELETGQLCEMQS